MSTIRRIRLDANNQVDISSCIDCSAHEDKFDPPVCLVCDSPIDLETLAYLFPSWCPLTTMAVIDPESKGRRECIECGERYVRDIVVNDAYKYSSCRKCGVRYYPKID